MIELITRAQAAQLLKVSETTVDRLISGGLLPAYKVHRACIRLDLADVEAYLEKRRVRASALSAQIKPVGVKDLRRHRQIEELPCGYVKGMKVVDPYG